MNPLIFSVLMAFVATVSAAELHVALGGKDANPGTPAAPLRTIQHAADLAQPGDVITVHAGVYRERVKPPRGGESDAKRIIYRAAPGERVEITGSEVVRNWEKVQGDVWKVIIPNGFFGSFNPYSDCLHGDWFTSNGRTHHTGAVYVNGDWMIEAAKLGDVLKPVAATPLWFGQVDQANTTIWAQFKGANPNGQLVEMNVRRTVFYPDKPGLNYITVRGFVLRQAATPWAPPTAEQVGLIGTHWSKGWIIENNTISHSMCTGITLGKYGDEWDNKAESAAGYVGTINRALKNGWTKENIGHHQIRNNTISHCEQAGIVGSLGAVFSTVTGNTIHDIHVRRLFSGAEMAGIKFHGAIDVEIRGNHIHHTIMAIWLDWMAQGTHVTGNLLHDNIERDLFTEVDHGPILVDNNIMLSPQALLTSSQGGAYVHNLIAGEVRRQNDFDDRMTPFHRVHSTEVVGLHDNPSGDDRYYNNIFMQRGTLAKYDEATLPVWMEGNVFLKGAKASKHEKNPLVKADFDAGLALVEKTDGFYLEVAFDNSWSTAPARRLVTTETLGKATIPGLAFENPDGTPVRVAADFFGKPRSDANPTPGPFETPGTGRLVMKVWPLTATQ